MIVVDANDDEEKGDDAELTVREKKNTIGSPSNWTFQLNEKRQKIVQTDSCNLTKM